jgi:hypothetical protein
MAGGSHNSAERVQSMDGRTNSEHCISGYDSGVIACTLRPPVVCTMEATVLCRRTVEGRWSGFQFIMPNAMSMKGSKSDSGWESPIRTDMSAIARSYWSSDTRFGVDSGETPRRRVEYSTKGINVCATSDDGVLVDDLRGHRSLSFVRGCVQSRIECPTRRCWIA